VARSRHAARAAWKPVGGPTGKGSGRDGPSLRGRGYGFPRSEYRPSWLYWIARAKEQAGDRDGAAAAFRAVVARIEHLLRTACHEGLVRRRAGREPASGWRRAPGSARPDRAPALADATPVPSGLPDNVEVIRSLIGLELFDLAQQELAAAERSWGRSPALLATQASVVAQ